MKTKKKTDLHQKLKFFFPKSSEDQKKNKKQKKVFTKIWRDFPQIQVKNKKKIKKSSSPKIEEFFSPSSNDDQRPAPNIIQRSDADHSEIIRGDAVVDHSQMFGGIYPPPLRVSAPQGTITSGFWMIWIDQFWIFFEKYPF